MRVTLLGTGTSQGVPVIGCECEVCRSDDPRDRRLRSSVMLESGDTTIVIDSGPDFRQQMLTAGVKRLDAVVLTHGHKDHTGGLDEVRSFNFLQKRSMPVYGQTGVLEGIRREFSYIFETDPYPGVPQLDLIEISSEPFAVGSLSLLPVPVLHGEMPVLGFRMGDFSYITDASHIPGASMKLIEGSDVIILNALRLKKHYSHFNLEEAVRVLEDLRPRRAFLTHIGHFMGRYRDVQALLPEWITPAWDGLSFEL